MQNCFTPNKISKQKKKNKIKLIKKITKNKITAHHINVANERALLTFNLIIHSVTKITTSKDDGRIVVVHVSIKQGIQRVI